MPAQAGSTRKKTIMAQIRAQLAQEAHPIVTFAAWQRILHVVMGYTSSCMSWRFGKPFGKDSCRPPTRRRSPSSRAGT
jgi:hypothetical protein